MSLIERTKVIDTLYSSTWDAMIEKGATDNIYQATPFMNWLFRGGNIKDQVGGKKLQYRLKYGKNTTVTSIGRGGTVSLAKDETVTLGESDWKNVVGNCTRYMVDEQNNAGTAKLADMVAEDLEDLKLAMEDAFENMLTIGDGTGNEGKDTDGLVNWIAKVPTNTVGGIDASVHTWWQNKVKASTGIASMTLLDDVRNLVNTCSRGKGDKDTPDLGITSQMVFELFQSALLAIYTIVPSDKNILFPNVTFGQLNTMWSPSCDAIEDELRVINSRYCKWIKDPRYHFSLGDWKEPPNQVRDRVAQCLTVGNLIFTNRAKQGLLHSISAT